MLKGAYTVINCNTYDYVEIACLYHLTVVAKLKDNREIVGTAITTKIALIENANLAHEASKEECIVLKAQSGEMLFVVLTQIISLTCLQQNPHFKMINFVDGTLTK